MLPIILTELFARRPAVFAKCQLNSVTQRYRGLSVMANRVRTDPFFADARNLLRRGLRVALDHRVNPGSSDGMAEAVEK